jgi:hypothetical protein
VTIIKPFPIQNHTCGGVAVKWFSKQLTSAMCISNHLWQWFYPKETTVLHMKQDLHGWPITQSNQYSISVTLKKHLCAIMVVM